MFKRFALFETHFPFPFPLFGRLKSPQHDIRGKLHLYSVNRLREYSVTVSDIGDLALLDDY